jgi:hypothetical protein
LYSKHCLWKPWMSKMARVRVPRCARGATNQCLFVFCLQKCFPGPGSPRNPPRPGSPSSALPGAVPWASPAWPPGLNRQIHAKNKAKKSKAKQRQAKHKTKQRKPKQNKQKQSKAQKSIAKQRTSFLWFGVHNSLNSSSW